MKRANPTRGAKTKTTSTIPDGWISSGEFAKAVGRGKTTVLDWAKKKKVETRLTARGDHLFRVEDAQRLNGGRPVETLPRAREHVPSIANLDGAIAGRVFRHLNAGDPPEKIVGECNINADTVEALLIRWRRFREGIYLDAGQLKTLRRAFLWRPFANSDEMVAQLCRIAKRLHCASCRENAAQYCGACQEAYADARSAVEFGATQQSGTPALQHEEPYTAEEAARERALMKHRQGTYGRGRQTLAKQPVPNKPWGPEPSAQRVESSAGTPSDAPRPNEPAKEPPRTAAAPASDGGGGPTSDDELTDG